MTAPKVPPGFWDTQLKHAGPHFSDQEIENLTEKLEAVNGNLVTSRQYISSELENFAQGYLAFKESSDKTLRPGAITKIYQDFLSNITNARQTMEDLRRNDSCGRPLASAVLNSSMSIKAPWGLVMDMVEHLRTAEEWAEAACEVAVEEAKYDKGGRRREFALYWLVVKLANLFKDATGEKPKIGYSDYTEKREGLLVDFIETYLGYIEPEKKRRALGQTIYDHLTKWQKIKADQGIDP